MYLTYALPNSGLASHLSKANNQETSVGWNRKGCFIREAGNQRRRKTHIQEPTPKILLGHDSFEREKGEIISVNRQGRGSD